MKLSLMHRAQLKASIYKLLDCPGVLTDSEVFDVLTEIVDELNEQFQGEN